MCDPTGRGPLRLGGLTSIGDGAVNLRASGTVPEVTAPGPVVDATVARALNDRDATFTSVRGGVVRPPARPALAPSTHVMTVASEGLGWLTASAVIVEIR